MSTSIPDAIKEKVAVVFRGQDLGNGTALADDLRPYGYGQVLLDIHYTWPQAAPAEVRGNFHMALLDAERGEIELELPGLLAAPITDRLAAVQRVLKGATEVYVIKAAGAFINFTVGHLLPSGVEGMMLEIAVAGQPPVTLTFPFLPIESE